MPTVDPYLDVLNALEVQIAVTEQLAALADTAADRLLTGDNPYRVGHILKQSARETRASAQKNHDRVESIRAIIEGHGE